MDLSELCKNYYVYEGQNLKAEHEAKRSVNPNITIESKLEVIEKGKAERIWPVFRWRCKYYSVTKSASNSEIKRELIKDAGLHMDNYCKQIYINSGADKASYHNYGEGESWYCTDVNPGGA